MRLIAFLLAMFAVTASAAAQGWKEYTYPSDSFIVSFPAGPQVETSTYQAADGRSVEARVYSVTQDDAIFKMTVVDLSDPAMEESAVIDHAIKTLSQGGEIKVNIPARINRVYGRQLSIVRPDGSRSSAAVFYHKGRLYQIEGKALFTGGESNRPDVVREARRNCRGAAGGAGAPGATAASDDPGQSRGEGRCRRGAR